jgi:hypothetical protein
MPDLNERMRGVDHVPFREDWDAIERRASSVEPMRAPTRPHAVRTIAILATTLLVLGVVLYSLSGLGSSKDGAATGPTPGGSSTAVYIDPAGIPITVDFPTDWFARSFTSSADGLSDGVEISNVEAVVPPEDPAGQSLPLNYVRVTISTSKQQVASSLPDSPLPLSMDDASVTLGPGNTRQLMARVGGVPFVIQVSAGPNASEADLADADAIVVSIRPNGSEGSSISGGPSFTLGTTSTVNGIQVAVPEGWSVAQENLTPWLSSPVEVLSVGTFEMPVSHHPGDELRVSDAPVAPAALAAMTATDAFVSLQASGSTNAPDDRPPSFRTAKDRPCCSARIGDYPFTWWWIPFIDQGRAFYLFVAIGNHADSSISDQAWAIADSLVVPNNAETPTASP